MFRDLLVSQEEIFPFPSPSLLQALDENLLRVLQQEGSPREEEEGEEGGKRVMQVAEDKREQDLSFYFGYLFSLPRPSLATIKPLLFSSLPQERHDKSMEEDRGKDKRKEEEGKEGQGKADSLFLAAYGVSVVLLRNSEELKSLLPPALAKEYPLSLVRIQ
jgi:hypothetical protein